MDEALVRLAKDWLTKAWHDLLTARIVAQAEDGPLDTAIYHCQQAAEKSVKGWLAFKRIPFEKTHDIRRLIELAAPVEKEFEPLADSAERLTPYATAFRYPGLEDEALPLREEFDTAFLSAQSIYEFVLSNLPTAARPVIPS